MAHIWPKFALVSAMVLSLGACMDVGLEGPRASSVTLPSLRDTLPAETTDWNQLAELPWPQGGQTRFRNFEESKRAFWNRLYADGGTDLYCGLSFEGKRASPPADDIVSVEHVFPADAIAETEPGCTNRTCTAARVQRAMADLQNLWPALQKVNASRSRLRFGMLPQTVKPRFPEFCPAYRRGIGSLAVVEPRDAVKGDVARTIVYMHFVYGLPLEDAVDDKQLLLDWMALDPPDHEELRRNVMIDQLQGAMNPLLEPAFVGM